MSDKPQLKVSTGPFKNVIVLGHATVEDYDREAGKAGQCLADADKNVLYRDTLPTIHDAFAKQLAELSGVTRGVNAGQTAKNQKREDDTAAKAGRPAKKVADVEETFVDWASRIKSTVDEEKWAAIDKAFREVALANPVDASPSSRVGSATKANTEKADEILTRTTDAIEATVSKLLAEVPDFDLAREEDGTPERLSLARLVGAFYNAQLNKV